MFLKIEKCSDPMYWYSNSIGKLYDVIRYCKEDGMFLVRDNDGYLNIVNKNDVIVLNERKDENEL